MESESVFDRRRAGQHRAREDHGLAEGQVIGEAREVQPDGNGTCFAYVRLFQMPEGAEHGRIEKQHLRSKAAGLAGASDAAEGEAQ